MHIYYLKTKIKTNNTNKGSALYTLKKNFPSIHRYILSATMGLELL